MPSLPRLREPLLAVGVAASSSVRIKRSTPVRTMRLDSSIAVAQYIAVAATQPRCTTRYTPAVHRHSAAKRRPSSDGPRLTALAVFRPAETGRGRSTLPRRRTDTSVNMGYARQPFRRRYAFGTTRKCTNGIATALPLCRHASACSYSGPAPRLRRLKHPLDQRAPGITPAARSPSPVRTSLRSIVHVA